MSITRAIIVSLFHQIGTKTRASNVFDLVRQIRPVVEIVMIS